MLVFPLHQKRLVQKEAMCMLWSKIYELDGQTLQTVARGKAFLVRVEDDRVWFEPAAGSSKRWTARRVIEEIVENADGNLTHSEVQEAIGNGAYNSSYVHAVLARLGLAV